MAKHSPKSVRRSRLLRPGVCPDDAMHEHEVFLFRGAVTLGTWPNVVGVNRESLPCGCLFVWRVLSCGCACAVGPVVPCDIRSPHGDLL